MHMEVRKDFKDDLSKPLSLAEKKLKRLARNRATASVSRYMDILPLISVGIEKCMGEQSHMGIAADHVSVNTCILFR